MSNYTINVDWDGKDALADSSAAKVISGDDFQTEFETVQTAVNSKADLNGSSSEDFAMDNGTVAGTLAVTGATTLTGTTTLGGNPTTTTQSAGNNTTRIATTAFVTTAANALNAAAYPIGSLFTTTVAYANSAAVVTAIGGTTWEAFGEGRVLIGAGTSSKDDQEIVATSIVEARKYQILSTGTTDFTLVGAGDSNVDTIFTANSTAGLGTGTVAEVKDFTAAATGGEFNHTLTEAEMPAHTHNSQGVYSTVADGAAGINWHTSRQARDQAPVTLSTGDDGSHNNLQPYIVVYFWKRTA